MSDQTISTSTEPSSEKSMFDIRIGEHTVGLAYDKNPIVVESDEQCREILERIKPQLTMTKIQAHVLETCIKFTEVEAGQDFEFGPIHIFEIGELAKTNPGVANELLACSHFFTESMEWEGDIPEGFFLKLALSHGSLSDIMAEGLEHGPISDSGSSSEEDPLTYEDFISSMTPK